MGILYTTGTRYDIFNLGYDKHIVKNFETPVVRSGEEPNAENMPMLAPQYQLVFSGEEKYSFDTYFNFNIAQVPPDMVNAFTNAIAPSLLTSVALDDISDVVLSNPSSGQVLQFNGTNWVNATSSSTIGGSSSQVQYNSSGSFAGDSGLTYSSSAGIEGLGGILLAEEYSGASGSSYLYITGQASQGIQLKTGAGSTNGASIVCQDSTSGNAEGFSVTAGNATSGNAKGGGIAFQAGNGNGTQDAGLFQLLVGTKGSTAGQAVGDTNGFVEIISHTAARVTGSTSDDYAAGLRMDPSYQGAFTLTRHNYIDLQQPSLSSTTLTDACVFRFDAAAGTHKAVDSGSTKTTPGTVDAWLKVNINGTVYYVPAYTSKTS